MTEKAFDHIPLIFREAHGKSSKHRQEVLSSRIAGCFFCCNVFPPDKITKWIDENETAICPLCGIDAVLPNNGEYEIWFLRMMHRYWFGDQDQHKVEPPYSKYIPGIELALKEIRWKMDHHLSLYGDKKNYGEHSPGFTAFMTSLVEIENTLQMYLNQVSKDQRPGLFSTTNNNENNQ